MPSWQAAKPPQPHMYAGTCWCGYITGLIGRDIKKPKPSGEYVSGKEKEENKK